MEGLSANAAAALPYIWDFWAIRGHQLPPAGDWRTWVLLGGRGAGKTRAGSEWIRWMAEGATPLARGRAKRIALVAETLDQGREVMIEGPSGIRAVSPPDRRPKWEATRKRLVWPNGAEARVFSARDPEGLRGPQFDAAWGDELAKWPKARAVWQMLQFGLRLGRRPRQLVTTTPRRVPLLAEIMKAPGTVVGRAPTSANRANLAPDFIAEMEREFGGTALARQELEGEFLSEEPGALWPRAILEAGRVREAPALERVVVAVDPPVTGHAGSDECGIVVAGVASEGGKRVAYVLADESVQGLRPEGWAARAVAAFETFQADRIVAEVNQGGDLVESVLRQVAPDVPYTAVRASRGKAARAEPVSAKYEQGLVRHVGSLPALEDQMCAFTGDRRGGSPDRVDALVWAITELLLKGGGGVPRVRGL
ncbi:DNA-packaging protein [Rhodovulum sp. DZ06]|uniref:DNA-packaging protein n=1 Tax=Rhodovulum sp. DZ06 TaxID=3425126 RepID=UPI003D346AF6